MIYDYIEFNIYNSSGRIVHTEELYNQHLDKSLDVIHRLLLDYSGMDLDVFYRPNHFGHLKFNDLETER